MEVERHLFCIFNLFIVLNFKIFGRVEGRVAQTTIEEKELSQKWFWLNEKFSHPSLEPFILSFCMLEQSMVVQCGGGGSRMGVRQA
jgi:hypothetical protein